MFHRTKILIITVLTLLLLAPTAFASQLDDKRSELENINARIKATKNKQENTVKRQEEVRLQIKLSDQRLVQIQTRLNNLQTELNNTITSRRNAEKKLSETQNRLDEALAKLTSAQERLALRREVFNKRLVNTYKNDKTNVIIVLLSSENFSDLIKRVALLGMIAEEDSRIVLGMKRLTTTIRDEVAQVEATKKAINRQRLQLVAEEKRIGELKGGIVAMQNQLQDEISKQQQLYAQLQQEKERLARAEGQLKASSSKVAEQIRALERQNSSRGGTIRAAGTSAELTDLAEKTARKYGIPTKLFFALIKQESGWNYRAVSRAGAIGLTQVMPFNVTAMGYDIEEFRNSPGDQLEAGAIYLSRQYKTFGRWDLALAAYNAGPGAVMAYGGIPPYRETQNYVKSILRMAGQ